ncbi:MAG: translocation/assembly module TamB domain-containing protein [Firmicutes bacterium]|nr:translocation/assembly module TamB domain-containing protein [Bacillota bacterium]
MSKDKKQPAKWSKIKKVFLVTGILLFVAILAFLPFSKGIAKQQIKTAINKSLRGSFDFQDFSISASQISMTEPVMTSKGGQKWIAAEKITVSINLLKALNPSSWEKSLTSIEVAKPYVVLATDKKGKFNLDGFFIPGEPKPVEKPGRELAFDCPVYLSEGTVHYSDSRDKHRISASTKDVKGSFHFYSIKNLQVDLHATTEEEDAVLDIKGRIIPETFGIYLNVKGRGLTASKWGNYIAGASPHRLTGGRINLNANLASKNIYSSPNMLESIDITGRIFVDRCSFETPLLQDQIKNIEGKILLTKDTLTVEKLKAVYRNTPLTVGGGITGLLKPKLRVFVNTKSLPLATIIDEGYKGAEKLKTKGTLAIDTAVSGMYDSPEVKSTINAKKISIEGEEFSDCLASFEYFKNTISFELRNALFSGGNISGSGWINIEDNRLGMLEFHGRNTDIGRLVRKFAPGQRLTAISDFDVRIIGTPSDPLVLGTSSVSGLSYSDKNIGSGSANFIFGDGSVVLSDIVVHTPGGVLISPGGYVDLKDKMLDFSVSTRDFNVPASWLPSGMSISARTTAKARILGGFEAPIVTADIADTNLVYNGKPINNISGSFIFNNNTISLRQFEGDLAGSPFRMSGWFNLNKGLAGQAVFDIHNTRLSNLAVVNPYFGTLNSSKTINLSGMITGENNQFGWGISGRGELGNLAAFGSIRNTSGTGFSANVMGWNTDLNEFISPENYKYIQPGNSNFVIMAKGSPSAFRAYYLVSLENGKTMGLPVNKGRGIIRYSSGKITLADNHWEGFYSAPGRDRRVSIIDDDYNLSTYWGFDSNPDRVTTPFARMYFLPYVLEGAVFTRNGWQASMVKPVVFRKDALPGEEMQPIDGLPVMWLSMRQLRRNTDGGFPQSVSFRNTLPGDKSENLPVFSTWVDGSIDLNRKTLALNVKSREMDTGFIMKKLDLSGQGVSIKKIRKDLSLKNIEGTANLDGKILGYWNSPMWKGSFTIQDGILDHEAFAFNSDFSVDKKGLDIRNFDYKESVGSYCGSGKIDFSKEMPLNLTINAAGGKLENLIARSPFKDVKARGTLWGKIQINGTASSPLLSGNLSLKNATVLNMPVYEANADLKSTTDSFTLKNLYAKTDGSEITGEGSLKGQNIDFTFKSDKLNLSTLEYLDPELPKMKGEASAFVKLSGTKSSPVADIQMSTGEFTVKKHPFRKAGGRIHWGNHTLSLEKFTLEGIESYWKLDGGIYFPKGTSPLDKAAWDVADKDAPVLNIKSEVKNWSLANVLDINDSPFKDIMDGKIEGEFELSGSMSRPEFKLGLRLKDGIIAGNVFNTFDSFITYRPGLLDINRIEYIAPKSHALITGQIDEEKDLFNINADAEDMPVEMLHPFIPGIRMLKGKIQTITKITGDLRTPELMSDTRLTNGSFGIVEFDEAGGNFKSDNGVILFDDMRIRKDKHAISFAGRIPIEINNGQITYPEDMEISTNIDDNSLDTLSLVVPGLADTDGSFKGNLKLTGKYPSFSLTGKTEIKGGRMKLSYMDNYIENINARINFLGKDIDVSSIKGKLGDGDFDVAGKAHISDTETTLDSINMHLNGSNLAVLIPGLIKGKVDASLSVTGSLMRPIIGGSTRKMENYIGISNATISLPDEKFKQLASLQPAVPKKKESTTTDFLLHGIDWWDYDKGKNAATAKSEQPLISPVKQEKQESFMPEIRNLVVRIGTDVWLDFKGLFIKSDGNVHISFHPSNGSDIDGKISFSRGTLQFPFLRNPFRVSKGEVIFEENASGGGLNPILALEASTYASSVEIFMDYRGTLDDLKDSFEHNKSNIAGLNLYSYPAYSREEILELLVSNALVGVPSLTSNQNTGLHSNLEGTAVNMLANYMQGLLLTPITRQFGRAFSLSEIFFEMGVSGTWNLRISKALDAKERFFLTYSQTKAIQGQTTGIWGIEYKYKPGMRLRLESYEGAMTGSIQGQIQFDGTKEFFRELFNIVKKKKKTVKKTSDQINPQ